MLRGKLVKFFHSTLWIHFSIIMQTVQQTKITTIKVALKMMHPLFSNDNKMLKLFYRFSIISLCRYTIVDFETFRYWLAICHHTKHIFNSCSVNLSVLKNIPQSIYSEIEFLGQICEHRLWVIITISKNFFSQIIPIIVLNNRVIINILYFS